jgi:Xaa-Pro aminopeptidase
VDRYQQRRDRLRRGIRKAEADALLVTNFVNVTYLSGFTGDDSYLLVARDGEGIVSDPRYTTQLEEECEGLELHIRKPGVSMLDMVAKIIRRARLSRVAFEADSMTVALRDQLAERLPQVQFCPTTGLVEHLRAIKDADEVARIREAIWMAEKAFGVIRATLRPEHTEKAVADELEHQMRGFGARGCGFPSIIAAGPRAALPHARATNQPVGNSDFVLIDWGADGNLYKSDLTRILVTGKISPKLERVYRVVLNAQQQAIQAVRPGALTHDVDGVARQIIADAGFGRYFGHGLGHGLGLEIHEAPRLAAKTRTVLQPGMVVTVEPGIYVPGWGGVRIEDDVLVTRSGCEVLTTLPKQLEESVVG